MNTAQREVLEFLKHNLQNKPSKGICEFSPAFYEEMERHGLLYLLLPIMNETGIGSKWKVKIHKQVIADSAKNLILLQQIAQVLDLFHTCGIPVIVLKGLSLARLYPHPELRSMCDLDILTIADNWEEAKKVLLAHGLKQLEHDEYHPMHIAFGKVGHITVELHRGLIHHGYLGERNSGEWMCHLWERRRMAECLGLKFFTLSWEDELLHQIVHFANHFVYVGTRLRQLYEAALIIRTHRLDWEYIDHTLKSLGLLDFGRLLLTACAHCFDINIAPKLLLDDIKGVERFISDLLDYHCFEKTPGDFNGWIDILGRYPWIIRYPFLWPAGWAIELKSQLKRRGIKIKAVFSNAFRNIKAMTRKMRIIRIYLMSN